MLKTGTRSWGCKQRVTGNVMERGGDWEQQCFGLLFHVGTEKAEGKKKQGGISKSLLLCWGETHLAGKFENPADNFVSFKGGCVYQSVPVKGICFHGTIRSLTCSACADTCIYFNEKAPRDDWIMLRECPKCITQKYKDNDCWKACAHPCMPAHTHTHSHMHYQHSSEIITLALWWLNFCY